MGLSKHWEEWLGEGCGDTRTFVPQGTAEWAGLAAETLVPGVLAHDLLKANTLSAKRGEKHSFRNAYM